MRVMGWWCALSTAVVLSCSTASAASWLTDYEAALTRAKNERKPVLINFTGSDWCGWCIKLKAEVFDRPEFGTFAEENLVLLEIDSPRRKPFPAQTRKANHALAEKFGVQGFPTIVIANSDGKPQAELGYEPGGPRAFIAHIKNVPGFGWKDGVEPNTASGASTPANAKKEEPLWGGLITPPKEYKDLKLTGLSGSANRRFAIINNQTFAAGETAKVKLNSGQVKVLCKEIRAKSVLVQVDGSTNPTELFLGQN